MRRWRSNRLLFLLVSLAFCLALMFASRLGFLTPVENLAAVPLNVVTNIFADTALMVGSGIDDLAELQRLRARLADLEETLAQYQSEIVELREIASDYQRLAELLDYRTAATNQEFVTADVIGSDTDQLRRTIVINRGARDGITAGMPVVTAQGLVGRVMNVSANASRVLLVSDRESYVSGRLQSTRAQGSVQGQLSGNLRMTYIPLGQPVTVGDVVLTSGLGGNFPPDLVIGIVTSTRQREAELFQEADITSLINFDALEFVLVMTSFEPVDLSIFADD
jgi:rod shape-determining protein MreC